MSRRWQHSRCYICRTVLSLTGFALKQFSYSQGWHVTYPLCRVCYKAISDIVMEVQEQYR